MIVGLKHQWISNIDGLSIENLHNIMSMFRFEWELVLVANYWPGMSDRTPAICWELARRLSRVRVLAEPKQGEMGWDLRKGLDACRGKYVGIIDGDGQFPVETICSCFAKITTDEYDFVKTYRILRADGFYRLVISKVYNGLFHLLFPDSRGLRDINSKPKIMTRVAYRRMELCANDWFIDAEIILNCLALKLNVYEIPVQFHALERRPSFVEPGAVFQFLKHLIEYRFGGRCKPPVWRG